MISDALGQFDADGYPHRVMIVHKVARLIDAMDSGA